MATSDPTTERKRAKFRKDAARHRELHPDPVITPEERNRRAKYMRTWRAKNPGHRAYQREYQLRKKYGLSLDEWAKMWAAQGQRCKACGVPIAFEGKGMGHVDHSHATGAVRGILCQECNIALGHIKDDPTRLRMLADYIERYV